MVTSITSGRLVVFKKTVWLGIKPKHQKCSSHADAVIWSSKTCNLALHANLFLRWSHSQQNALFFSTFCFTYMHLVVVEEFKDDRAFSLLHQELPQILVLRFDPLVPVVKILKKNWGHRENLGESGGQTFKGSDREKCQF